MFVVLELAVGVGHAPTLAQVRARPRSPVFASRSGRSIAWPLRRAVAGRRTPDFQFPQDDNPDLARKGWYPPLEDYVYIAVTIAIAFSDGRRAVSIGEGPHGS